MGSVSHTPLPALQVWQVGQPVTAQVFVTQAHVGSPAHVWPVGHVCGWHTGGGGGWQLELVAGLQQVLESTSHTWPVGHEQYSPQETSGVTLGVGVGLLPLGGSQYKTPGGQEDVGVGVGLPPSVGHRPLAGQSSKVVGEGEGETLGGGVMEGDGQTPSTQSAHCGKLREGSDPHKPESRQAAPPEQVLPGAHSVPPGVFPGG